jgi:ABC transport system ATP-binding/permease protein
VLDEPTNDLDIESLELLESTLQGYAGTLLLVSHDRAFLDNVVTQSLVAEGDGRWIEYAGGYSDWLALRPKTEVAPVERAERGERAERAPARAPRVKLSFKEQREIELLPGQIEALEREQREITERMSRPEYSREGAERIKADRLRAVAIEHELTARFERWSALEQRANANA